MASALVIDQPLTCEDFYELPDDGKRYELIWGELYMSPSPNTRHQRSVRTLFKRIDAFLMETTAGEVSFFTV